MTGKQKWLVVIAITVACVAALSVYAYQRTRFDMVKTLAAIAANEGAWDNPWDLQPKKIASLQEQLGMERDPIQRLILRRELGQQYVNGGAAEAGIDTLEQLLAEYRTQTPAARYRDAERRHRTCVLSIGRAAELHMEPQLGRLHLSDPERGHPQRTTRRQGGS
jgi:hypothetical protein